VTAPTQQDAVVSLPRSSSSRNRPVRADCHPPSDPVVSERPCPPPMRETSTIQIPSPRHNRDLFAALRLLT
jgi:hypothetical protein